MAPRRRLLTCRSVLPLVLGMAALCVAGCAATAQPALAGEWSSEGLIVSTDGEDVDGRACVLALTARPEAKGEVTLHVLAADDPSNIEELAAVNIQAQVPAELCRVVTSPPYVHLSLGDMLLTIDISVPERPVEVARVATDYMWIWPVASDDLVVARTSLGDDFATFDISDPASPQKLSDFSVQHPAGAPQAAQLTTVSALRGSDFFVLERDGIHVFDLSSPSDSHEVDFYQNDRQIKTTSGDDTQEEAEAALSRARNARDVLDAMAPSGAFLDLAISGDRAYVAASDSGLLVLDISDIRHVAQVSSVGLPTPARRVAISGDYACVLGLEPADDGANPNIFDSRHPVYVVNISPSMTHPKVIAEIQGITSIPPWQDIIAIGESVLVSNNETLHAIDLRRGK